MVDVSELVADINHVGLVSFIGAFISQVWDIDAWWMVS